METDFIAVLTYKSTAEGGRISPAKSGIRPAVKFPFADRMTSGQQKFINTEWVNPGETVTAEITILATDYFEGTLYEGLEFEFKEGSRLTGTDIITKILNESLRAAM